MPTVSVADLAIGKQDSMECRVEAFYGRKPPEYAIYRTKERVLVQYADDPDLQTKQRRAMAPLNPLRGEINALIDGWRSAPEGSDNRRKAEHYDRRVADALVLGLEDDAPGAKVVLDAIKSDIAGERVAVARFQYLGTAFLVGALVTALVWLLQPNWEPMGLELWRAAAAGAAGAFFSIALAIRGRTVLPDLLWLANIMDAALRMTIGIMAASVLMGLEKAQVVAITFGGSPIKAGGGDALLTVLIIGFVAGFSERLVPDLLAKAATTNVPPSDSSTGQRKTDAGATSADAANKAANAAAPAANAPSSGDNAATAAEASADEDGDDGCACGSTLADGEATDDADLPPTAGGVAKAA